MDVKILKLLMCFWLIKLIRFFDKKDKDPYKVIKKINANTNKPLKNTVEVKVVDLGEFLKNISFIQIIFLWILKVLKLIVLNHYQMDF